MRTGRRVAQVIACVVLLGVGALGIFNGVNEWGQADTALQWSVTVGVLLYGVLGLAAGAGVAMRKRWGVALAIAFTLVVTYVPGAAVLGYGGPEAGWGAALVASLSAGLTGLAVTYAAHKAVDDHETVTSG